MIDDSIVSSTPKVSVVIPAFNASKTIKATLKSVIDQSFEDFEIIVINDGSTDDTLEVVNEIGDQRIKTFTYSNGGLATARNRGISHATGDYVAFLDADDLWTKDKLESQVEALENNSDAGLAYSLSYYLNEDGKSYHIGSKLSPEGDVYAHILVSNFLDSGSSPLVRKTVIDSIGLFDSTISGAADWDYWIRIAAKWPFVLIPERQIFYRQSGSSMSSRVDFMESCIISVVHKAFENAPDEYKYLKKRSLAEAYRYSAQLYITRSTDYHGLWRAIGKLSQSAQSYPPIIFQSAFRKIFVKILVSLLLSPSTAKAVFHKISQAKAIPSNFSIID